MAGANMTFWMEFVLLGLTENAKLQIPLFVLFLNVYIITMMGNLSIILLIRISPSLHTPMYFLLMNLSFVDLCYSSIITPNMLANILSKEKTIIFLACATQMFFFIGVGSTEVFLLAVMAYDRYAAICKPLFYNTIMTKSTCIYLVVGAYCVAFLHALLHTICTFRLSFCKSNEIIHFYCDEPPLLKISCSDTSLNVIMMVFVAGGLILGSLIFILVSYAYIVNTILNIISSEDRWRAFSTCSSHLACVVLLFGTLVFMYLRPSSKYSMEQDRMASVFYTMVIPMLNPLIYSLRNKEVKGAVRKIMCRRTPIDTFH
ncbi:olfactory receptor 8U1-like [Pleurodeles waltl]|uniref:olfactory receptor 8U1-like n=1 Tax=Pleurodeles waltl TaxID=8319 RepID=UPI003709B60D